MIRTFYRIFPVIWPLCLAAQRVEAETRVHITGMTRKSEMQVLEWMGGRLTHVRSSPLCPPLAEDAAFMLRELLLKDGHADAKVSWKISGSDDLTLVVEEGTRLSLGKVEVRGTDPEDAAKLSRIFAAPAEKDRPFGLRDAPFRETDVQIGISCIVQELKARGHWSAQATLANRATDPTAGVVSLTIEVQPGPLHDIGPTEIENQGTHGASLAAAAQRPFAGKSATTANVNAMRQAVEAAITRSGYPEATVRMSHSLENGRFIPQFSIDLGRRVRLRGLNVDGLVRTREDRVMARLIPLREGWYDQTTMNQRVRELLATGAFRSIRVETRPVGETELDATLHIEEARAREISFAAGFGSYLGLIARANYGDRNLDGRLWGLNSGLEISSRGVLGEARVTNPWLHGQDVSFSTRYYALIYGREGYDTFETGVDAKWIWKPIPHLSLEGLAGYGFVNLSEKGLPVSELGETVYGNPLIRFTPTLDFRDSTILPKDGWHLAAPIEIGAAVGETSAGYLRTGLEAGYFHKLSRHYDLGLGGEWAVLSPTGDGSDLPIDLRLFNGGARSVRSFPERELGPTANHYPTGGEAMWNLNAELIRNFGGAVKAVTFFDAGTLSRNIEDFASAEIECAAGLGVRIDLPIGPIRLEYGYNLSRDPGEPAGTFHFAIGCAY